MMVEDQGSHDDAHNKVSLRITPEKSNQNWDSCGATD
jgi:hypothetical protein